jgi:membrane protease YdiL (CAAX protease family)
VLSVLILPIVACLGCFNEQITFPESMKNIEMWMREMEESNKAILQTLIENSNIFILLLNIIMLALLPAMFEEFLFRGTLQPFFTQWLRNKSLAIIITAFIFSAIHFQFYGFLPRFFLGIYLGYLFIWGKSLWIPIIAHFMHNTNSLILNYILQQNDIDIDAIELNQISEFYPVVIFCTFSIVFFIYMLWKKYTKNVNQG